jgi:hypothetical protein
VVWRAAAEASGGGEAASFLHAPNKVMAQRAYTPTLTVNFAVMKIGFKEGKNGFSFQKGCRVAKEEVL